MANFPNNPKPSYPIDETLPEPEVLVSTHKDGTEQRRLKGSGQKRSFRLPFGSSCPLTDAERLVIANHYLGERTLNSFNWTHPERGEVILVKYVAAPNFRHVAYNAYEGEVQLKEVPA